MGIIKAFTGAMSSTFADQWKDIIIPSTFREHTIVTPCVLKVSNKGTGKSVNQKATDGVISNGSKIFVPENTAAVIFSQGGIEDIITTSGGYEYKKGEKSIFNKDGFKESIDKQVKNRVGFGGISDSEVRIAYVNLREIRDIKYGTSGPLIYNDVFYGCDLEIHSYGLFTIKVVNPEVLIRNFIPANTFSYSMDNEKVRSQILSDFIQSFNVAITSLSSEYRISQLVAESNKLSEQISNDSMNAGSWEERFGFKVVKVSIENIEYSQKSRKLVDDYNKKMMEMKPYKDITEETSDRIIKHSIYDSTKEKGNGVFKAILGLSFLRGQKKNKKSVKYQSRELKRLKSLLNKGIINEEEYKIQKNKILDIK
ncbi:SPFH domain-containing protein [Mycoplasmatota bacterium]|nr:SPFH domain-containing protein [Mycoplasmatota bacterium]